MVATLVLGVGAPAALTSPSSASSHPAVAPVSNPAAAPAHRTHATALPAPIISCDRTKPQIHCGGYFPAQSDGVLLAFQYFTPDKTRFGPGPYPTVVDYSGYEPATTFFDGIKDTFLSRGYAIAGVNIRGTGCSGGYFDYFEPLEWTDGYDAIEFLATQTQDLNGDIGMVGKSYPGITPLFVAPTRPPHLRAIVPGAFFSDVYRDVAYPGGIQNAVFAAGFSLISQPGNTLDQSFGGLTGLQQTCITNMAPHAVNPAKNPFLSLQEHPYDDDDPYKTRGPYELAKTVQVPVMVQLAWQDEELAARGIDYVNRLPAGVPWRAVLMNGAHDAYYGESSLNEITRFLSFYLKKRVPAGDACAGPVATPNTLAQATTCYQAEPKVAVLNDVNQDRKETSITRHATWPVTNQVDRLFLHTGGALTHAAPSTNEAATTYNYTPATGSNSYGTQKMFNSRVTGNDEDYWQTPAPAGQVAQFTTAPAAVDRLYTGNGSVDLWVSSTAADTDFEVMLTELRPDGRGGWLEEYVQKGRLRASHRKLDLTQTKPLRPYQTHQLTDVQPLTPATATPVRIELFPFAQQVRAGRRLRLTIQAPVVKPEIWGFAALPTLAQNSIYTDTTHPSSLALPIVAQPAGTTFLVEAPCGNIVTPTKDAGGLAGTEITRQLYNQPCRSVVLAAGLPAVDDTPADAAASLPEVPLSALLPVLGLLVVGLVLYRRRRQELSL